MNVRELVVSQGATQTIQKLADTWTAIIFSLAAADVSALYFLLVCKTAGGFLNAIGQPTRSSRRLRFRGGARSLCNALADRLAPGSLHLSQAVQHIDQTSDNKVVLTTLTNDVFQCDRVVLAVHAPYPGIDFSPALGEHKQWMQVFEQPGFHAEAVLTYEQPWWREKGLNGFSQSTEGPFWKTRDTSSDVDGVYSLTCVIAGEAGRALWNRCNCSRRARLMAHVGDVFSDYVPFPNPVNIDWSGFNPESWSRQVPCPVVPTAYMRDLAEDQWAVEGNLHFAASETSRVWRGHIEGSLAAGSRCVEEVLSVMRPVADELMIPRL
jgi:monoamine oxidase